MKRFLILIFLGLSLSGFSQNFFWSHTNDKICFGYLYNAYTTLDSRKLSSSDTWYIPTSTEILALETHLGGADSYKLKYDNTYFWVAGTGTEGTNQYGFNAKGSGNRGAGGGSFANIRQLFDIWSSTIVGSGDTRGMRMTRTSNDILAVSFPNEMGLGVRFVSDAPGITDSTLVIDAYIGNDGKKYNAVAINELYWLVDNIEETEYRNSDTIAFEGANQGYFTDAEWNALITGAWCVYGDDLNNQCK